MSEILFYDYIQDFHFLGMLQVRTPPEVEKFDHAELENRTTFAIASKNPETLWQKLVSASCG